MREVIHLAQSAGSSERRRPARRRRAWAAAAAIIAASLLAACSSGSSGGSPENVGGAGKISGDVLVFAASSLKGAFDKIGAQFEKAHSGVTVKFNYAGSSSLATQIGQAAPADVFASANTKSMKTVTDGGHASGTPQVFAKNTLEIMVAAGNPRKIKTVADLQNKDVKVAVCAPDVPCGAYSKDVFDKAGVTVHPVSEETSVSSVVTKVSLGEADAGIVYTTDVKAAKAGGDKITGVAIPDSQNVIAEYPIVQVKNAPNQGGAAALIKYVLSDAGQKVLASFGFLAPGQ